MKKLTAQEMVALLGDLERNPLTPVERTKLLFLRAGLVNDMLKAGFTEDDKAAAALCHNEAILILLLERKKRKRSKR